MSRSALAAQASASIAPATSRPDRLERPDGDAGGEGGPGHGGGAGDEAGAQERHPDEDRPRRGAQGPEVLADPTPA